MKSAKTCPFCESNDVLYQCDDFGYYVECFSCGARGPVARIDWDKDSRGLPQRAIGLWNKRSAD